MHWITDILLLATAVGVWGISGSLLRIAAHNEKFTPPETEPGERIAEGDVIVVRVSTLGHEQICSVRGIARDADGLLVAGVEPLGSR